MNTVQITYALKHDNITNKQFIGVFPSDRLPKKIKHYPCGFVANTDPRTKPGTHWVAFYFPVEDQAERCLALREQKNSEIPAAKITSTEEVERSDTLSDELILENIPKLCVKGQRRL